MTLSWSASSDDVAVTGYYVSRAKSATGTFTRIAYVSGTSYVDDALARRTRYYRCVLTTPQEPQPVQRDGARADHLSRQAIARAARHPRRRSPCGAHHPRLPREPKRDHHDAEPAQRLSV